VAQLNPQASSTHFSRLLRHAWATVGLFFSPVTKRGEIKIYETIILLLFIWVWILISHTNGGTDVEGV
jgi:hypothetical protein